MLKSSQFDSSCTASSTETPHRQRTTDHSTLHAHDERAVIPPNEFVCMQTNINYHSLDLSMMARMQDSNSYRYYIYWIIDQAHTCAPKRNRNQCATNELRVCVVCMHVFVCTTLPASRLAIADWSFSPVDTFFCALYTQTPLSVVAVNVCVRWWQPPIPLLLSFFFCRARCVRVYYSISYAMVSRHIGLEIAFSALCTMVHNGSKLLSLAVRSDA